VLLAREMIVENEASTVLNPTGPHGIPEKLGQTYSDETISLLN
jgi:hypothetical protein